MNEKRKLVRDNVDMEIIEELQKQFPGMEIVFPNQLSYDDIPQEIKDFEKKVEHDLMNGLCTDCGQKIPGVWPPPFKGDTDEVEDDWKFPDGWRTFTEQGDIVAIQCPECDQKEEERLKIVDITDLPR